MQCWSTQVVLKTVVWLVECSLIGKAGKWMFSRAPGITITYANQIKSCVWRIPGRN